MSLECTPNTQRTDSAKSKCKFPIKERNFLKLAFQKTMSELTYSLKAANALTKYTFFDIKRIIFKFFYSPFLYSLYHGLVAPRVARSKSRFIAHRLVIYYYIFCIINSLRSYSLFDIKTAIVYEKSLARFLSGCERSISNCTRI